MIRNLKILIVAAMALGAFGVFNAAGAQAAEFHCSVEPCRFTLSTDGTEETAHHVFAIKNAKGESITLTCESLTGEGTSTPKTAPSLTITNPNYDKCASVLGKTTVDMNGCEFKFSAAGTVTVVCPTAKRIVDTASASCRVEVGPQGPLNGIGFHNINKGSGKGDVTVTVKVPGIVIAGTSAEGTCGTFKIGATPLTAEYTTGNTTVTAEKDNELNERVEGWWE